MEKISEPTIYTPLTPKTYALYEHFEDYGEHAKIFHRDILVESFPTNNNNQDAIELRNRLEDTEHHLKSLMTIALPKPITSSNTNNLIQQISNIKNLGSYTFKMVYIH